MLGASRTSQQQLRERLTAVYEDPTQREFLQSAGTGILTIVDATDRERSLLSLWADTSTAQSVKEGVLGQVFGQHVPQLSQDVVAGVIGSRWSSPADMVDALEEAGVSLLLMAAEADGRIDTVEGELFRFDRTLAASPDLQMALTNPATSSAVKTGIVSDLVDGKVDPITSELLVYLAGHLRGRRMQSAIGHLSDLAAVRRDRVVATVTAAVELTDEQKTRLAAALSKIHGKQVIINASVDPGVVGGIQVQIGDEVIDGTLANRIEQARRRLTS